MSKTRDLGKVISGNYDIPAASLDNAAIAVNNNISTLGQLGNRNLIINGAMQVAQRATGPVSVAPYQYNTADRMRFSFSGANAGSWTQEVVSGQDVGDYIGNALKNTCTAAGDVGITAGNNIRLEKTNIEKFVGKTLTLSFYAKADAPLTMTPQVFGDTIVDLDQLTFTTSYQRYVSTFVVPVMTTKSFFDLSMRVDASVATTHYITGIQLEVGDTATPFEHRSYGQELALCQRYYQRTYSSTNGYAIGFSFNGNQIASQQFTFPVKMRTTPTFTSINPTHISTSGNWGIYYATNGWSSTGYTPNFSQAEPDRVTINFGSVSGISNLQAFLLNGGFTADAEL